MQFARTSYISYSERTKTFKGLQYIAIYGEFQVGVRHNTGQNIPQGDYTIERIVENMNIPVKLFVVVVLIHYIVFPLMYAGNSGLRTTYT